jgi:hypothetical protein
MTGPEDGSEEDVELPPEAASPESSEFSSELDSLWSSANAPQESEISADIAEADSGVEAALPQTGHNWAPALLAAALGAALIAVDVLPRRKRRRKEQP